MCSRVFLRLLLAGALFACGRSAPPPAPLTPPEPGLGRFESFSGERAWADLEAFSAIGSRVSGSRGARSARQYIRSQLAMVGVGVEHTITASDQGHHYTAPERWLLVGGVVLALAAMVGIEVASKRDIRDDLRRSVITSRLVVIALALLVGVIGRPEAPATVVVLAVLCGALVLTDLVIATVADM